MLSQSPVPHSSHPCVWDCTAKAGKCRWVLSALALTWHFREQRQNCPVLASVPASFSPPLVLRHSGILHAHPGSWQPCGRVRGSAPGVRSAAPGRTDGRQGGLEVTEAVPQLGRKRSDLGNNSCPLPAASKQSLQLHSCRCRAHVHSCPGASGPRSAGSIPRGCVTAGHQGTEQSVLQHPVPHPCPGSWVPCKDKDRLP